MLLEKRKTPRGQLYLGKLALPKRATYVCFFYNTSLVKIAMEYCAGGSLEGCYKKYSGCLTETEICCILRKSLCGLQYLHSHGQMHRDIKAGNILITGEGEIKLGTIMLPLCTPFADFISGLWRFHAVDKDSDA